MPHLRKTLHWANRLINNLNNQTRLTWFDRLDKRLTQWSKLLICEMNEPSTISSLYLFIYRAKPKQHILFDWAQLGYDSYLSITNKQIGDLRQLIGSLPKQRTGDGFKEKTWDLPIWINVVTWTDKLVSGFKWISKLILLNFII